jgi:hypothetical protein
MEVTPKTHMVHRPTNTFTHVRMGSITQPNKGKSIPSNMQSTSRPPDPSPATNKIPTR